MSRAVPVLLLGVLVACGCKPSSKGPIPSASSGQKAAKPVTTFNELVLENERLESQANTIQTYADSIANSEWSVKGFHKATYPSSPIYEKVWASTDVGRALRNIRHRMLPFKQVCLRLKGDRKDDKDQPLDSLSADFCSIPAHGWAATLHVRLHDSVRRNPPKNCRWTGRLCRVEKECIPPILFYTGTRDTGLSLMIFEFNIPIPEQHPFELHYIRRPKAEENRNDQIGQMLVSAESLRKAMLEEIAEVRKVVMSDIDDWKSVSIVQKKTFPYDSNGIPLQEPYIEPPTLSQLDPGLKDSLKKKANEILDARQKLIERNYGNFFKAITSALPREVFESLNK